MAGGRTEVKVISAGVDVDIKCKEKFTSQKYIDETKLRFLCDYSGTKNKKVCR